MKLPSESWSIKLKHHVITPQECLSAVLDSCIESWYIGDIDDSDAVKASAIIEEYVQWRLERGC